MINYEIKGGSLPVVVCYPEPGQTLCTERGSMSWMSPNMEMATHTGGVRKAIGRLFSGESIFLNEFTAQGSPGKIAFSSSFPGRIIPYQVSAGNGIIVQKGGFLAMEKGLDLSMYFQKKLGAGFFGGEGFIMQKITGSGMVFIEIDGYCEEYDLAPGETIIVDTGYLAAMSESCSIDIQSVKGVKNVLFGGSGIFHTRITGPGKVYLQSMPVQAVAEKIGQYIPSSSSSGSGGDSGIKISFGD